MRRDEKKNEKTEYLFQSEGQSKKTGMAIGKATGTVSKKTATETQQKRHCGKAVDARTAHFFMDA